MGKYSLYVVREELRFFQNQTSSFWSRIYCSLLTQLFNHDQITVFRRLSRLPCAQFGTKTVASDFRLLFKSKFLFGRIWNFCLTESPWIRSQASAVLSKPNNKNNLPRFHTTYTLMIYGRFKNTSYYQTYLRANFLLVGSVNILLLHTVFSMNSASRRQMFFLSKSCSWEENSWMP